MDAQTNKTRSRKMEAEKETNTADTTQALAKQAQPTKLIPPDIDDIATSDGITAYRMPAPATYFHPAAIMSHPETLYRLIRTYFYQHSLLPRQRTEDPEEAMRNTKIPPPTPASLALALGFASVPVMLEAAEDNEHPIESRSLLQSAMTQLEASLSEGALVDKVNTTFTKYLLSARMNITEKSAADEGNKIQINILGVSDAQVHQQQTKHIPSPHSPATHVPSPRPNKNEFVIDVVDATESSTLEDLV